MRITTVEDQIVTEYLAAKDAADQADFRLKIAEDRLLEAMEQAKRKSHKWTDERGRLNTVTYVRANRTVIDEKGLRKALTAKVFDKYTKKTLDRKAMEKAMEEKLIDPEVVARYVSAQPSAPFIKYSVAEQEEL